MDQSKTQLKKPATIQEKTTALQFFWKLFDGSEPSDEEISAIVETMREDPRYVSSFINGAR